MNCKTRWLKATNREPDNLNSTNADRARNPKILPTE